MCRRRGAGQKAAGRICGGLEERSTRRACRAQCDLRATDRGAVLVDHLPREHGIRARRRQRGREQPCQREGDGKRKTNRAALHDQPLGLIMAYARFCRQCGR